MLGVLKIDPEGGVGVMNGAELIVKFLEQEKVEIVFGHPGGAILPLYDALRQSRIRHVLARHEQAAAHAADGYARATGKVGVCMATSGPGATNLVTGIANAYMDSIPMVIFTGQVPTDMIGTDSFQEVDITGATLPFTKHNYLVKDVNLLPRVIKEAFHIARTGRPGPVLVDLPADICLQAVGKVEYPSRVDLPGYKPTYRGHPLQVARAATAIQEAKRPVLCAGGGVISSGASEELLTLAERAAIPVTITMMGIGAFPATHPLFLGMLGLHGLPPANHAVMGADLLLAVGVRFGNRVTGKVDIFAHQAKVVHIDIDPVEIGKNVPVDIPIVGDAKLVLRDLLERVHPVEKVQRQGWFDQIERWKTSYQGSMGAGVEKKASNEKGKRLKGRWVVERLNQILGKEGIILTDVGQHQMWAAQLALRERARSFISSGGLGTMGFGLPAAIGAKLGCPDEEVVLITGDGGFQMNMQELSVAAKLGLNLKIFILNNHSLGMVRQLQEFYYNKEYYSIELSDLPDMVKLIEAFGGTGFRVDDPAEVDDAIKRALASEALTLVDFLVDPNENVYPMVPRGKGIDEMIGG